MYHSCSLRRPGAAEQGWYFEFAWLFHNANSRSVAIPRSGGTAIAEALVGDIDPAGKLTFTWPKRLGDAPSRAIGTQDHDNVNYKEGVFLGYRYFDTKDITPQFPFGYGLSYADFQYSNLKVAQNDADINIALQVKNGSTVPGTEIVQIYLSPPGSPVARPIR